MSMFNMYRSLFNADPLIPASDSEVAEEGRLIRAGWESEGGGDDAELTAVRRAENFEGAEE
jgi:hypothetical protein